MTVTCINCNAKVKGENQIRLQSEERCTVQYGKHVQMESSSPSQLLGRKSQEHEEAHSGQRPMEKAKSWDQSQHPMS